MIQKFRDQKQGPSMSSAHQDVFVQPNTDINIINEAMTIIGVSPIISKKKAHGSYMENKGKRIETAIPLVPRKAKKLVN